MPELAQDGVLLLMDAPAAAHAGPDIIQTIVLFAIIAGIMYLFIFLPQNRERKAKDKLLSSLVADERVVLASGIHGRIVSVGDDTVVVDLGDRTKVTVDKAAIARKVGDDADKK